MTDVYDPDNEFDLSAYHGHHLTELTGRAPFPPVGEARYVLSLSGHGFYWLNLAVDR